MGLENEGQGSVWNNLKLTSALFMLLLYSTSSSPLLRPVGHQRGEFSWPEIFLSLLDHWLITNRFGHCLIQNPTEEQGYLYSVCKAMESQSKFQKPNKIAC